MSTLNVVAGALAVGVLVAGGTAVPTQAETPAGGAHGPAQPLTVISLTDDDGSRTGVAVAGLDELAVDSSDGAVDDVQTGYTAAPAGAGAAGIGRGVAAVRPAVTGTAAALENVAVLTPPMATDEFMVAGLTWEAGDPLPAGGRVFLRVLEDGSWSDWLEVEEEDGADEGRGGRAGTDPFVTGGATAVQIQVTGDAVDLPAGLEVSLIPAAPDPAAPETVVTEPTDEPAELPAGEPTATTEPAAFTSLGATRAGVVAAAVTTDRPGASGTALPGSTAAAAPAGALPATAASFVTTASASGPTTPAAAAAPLSAVAPAAVTTPRPAITSRAGWGADESLMDWRRTYAPLRATVVHHTAGSNTYAWDESASVVRGIYHYHAVTRGWGDIGYNFLVDRWGRVFEGRSGSLAAPEGQMVVGGHAQPFNSGTLGISAMGTFTSSSTPSRTPILDSMADVVAWQFARAGIDMTSPSGLISNGTPTRPAGQNLPRIFGHKDVSNTSCPGLFYGDLSRLSVNVNARMPQLFHLNNAFGPVADITFRYGDKGAEVFVGDWDGDGVDSIATRVGNTFDIRNSNSYGPADRVVPYGKVGDTVLVGDWDGDGVDTFAVRRGKEYYVKNSLTSGPADVVIAYGHAGDQVLVGDWNGDGQDTFTVRRGHLYYVKNRIAGGEADTVVGYGRATDSVLVGDWDGDGNDTFAVKRTARYYIKNTIAAGDADFELVYGRPTDWVIVGDWNGDSEDTLGVVRP
ncbi:N-acetylmuramoyl-L-alanine amidase [Georgenia sp. EYE_87]|uniref:N-acetylmuramoyl-L-alanine amidase n=1 Tax=Georgenia sp. EYE_87 TaxID=2853448 RepID=UPI002003E29A|nr:N-acetylmuramoyl-L-alanine amidase [Georgenia sp. EYE_87]MCK6211778.1 N-acetylmuramoyl-L-alanine amidase [Georgenia sp. EYE_87]